MKNKRATDWHRPHNQCHREAGSFNYSLSSVTNFQGVTKTRSGAFGASQAGDNDSSPEAER